MVFPIQEQRKSVGYACTFSITEKVNFFSPCLTGEHDVQKPGQTENISEQPETGEKAADAPVPYLVENARHDYAVGNGGLRVAAAMADKPVQRASLKEKLAAYKAQVSGAGRADTEKAKRKEETL